MSARLLDELALTERGGKPRETGITIAVDNFKPIDWDLLEETSGYVDYVTFELSIPLMVERSKLLERVRHHHDLGIRVLSSGTLMDVAAKKMAIPKMVRALKDFGFDSVGVPSLDRSGGRQSVENREEILREVSQHSMEPVLEVGSDQGGTEKVVSAVRDAASVKGCRVIVEVPVLGSSQEGGSINWEALNEIAGTFGPPNLIFDTLAPRHRTELVLEFGPEVSLSRVPIDEILGLEMERLGLTRETLGTSRPLQNVDGPPAAKFIYHLVRAEHPIDQGTLVLRSGLPRRTVQGAIRFLLQKGLLREVSDTSDMRRHKYTPS